MVEYQHPGQDVEDHADDPPAGLYEQQDPNQRDLNLRGQFVTDEEGRYSLYCLRPTPYPVRVLPVHADLTWQTLKHPRFPTMVPLESS